MRIKLAFSCLAIALLTVSVVFSDAATAQVNVQVQIPLPTIRFETAPVLVEVSPGVQVVEDYDQEVFFVDGWYWHRSGPTWYRTRNHRGGWIVVHEREVPRGLVRMPPGKYRHYRAKGPRGNEQRREMAHPREVQVRREEHNDHHGNDRHGNDRHDNDHHDHQEHKDHKESKHGHR